MKEVRIDKPSGKRRGLLVTLALILLALLAVGVVAAYRQLHALWLEQCVITDATSQVKINASRKIKVQVVDRFCLTNGANLATIDFDKKRMEALKEIPNIRTLTVARHLPDRVVIDVEERVPFARIKGPKKRGMEPVSTRVTDTEGVVFLCGRDLQLPSIREAEDSGLKPGHRLEGRTLAALRLLEAASEKPLSELGVLEADVAKRDFILITLGNYSQAKVAWDGMDNPTEATRANLVRQLDHLLKAIQSKIGDGTLLWNATQSDSVYADPKKGYL